jgi:hypothetical protein
VLLCWHHFEELVQHRARNVASDRVALLRGLPLVAWISCFDGEEGFGSIVDILAAEAGAAFESPNAGAVEVRDVAAKRLITVGTGERATAPYLEIWEQLQPLLRQREARAREIVAISRSKYLDISNTKVVDWLHGELRSSEDTRRAFGLLHRRLADDIGLRGDKRIPDSSAVAEQFLAGVEHQSRHLRDIGSSADFKARLIGNVELSEVRSEMTMGELNELVEFRQKLRVASGILRVPWDDLRERVGMHRIPSYVIQTALRKFGQDIPERRGSELGDSYLACLAAYADVTCVDKRTNENFVRARRKSPQFASITRRVVKAGRYDTIAQLLES